MVTSLIFLIKKTNLKRHIKHENPLSIYENMDYFQIMLVIVSCRKFQKKKQPFIKIYLLGPFQYQYCGNIAKTRLHSWKIIKYLVKQRVKCLSIGSGHINCNLPLKLLSLPGNLNYFMSKPSLETWLGWAKIHKGQQTDMSNAKNISIWWRHHGLCQSRYRHELDRAHLTSNVQQGHLNGTP